MEKFPEFKSNFKERIGKNLQNIDKESITSVRKTYEDLYKTENFKQKREIKNLAINLATVIDIIYLNNTQKGGDNEIECPICFGENKDYEPPIDIVECPTVAENRHGCCKLCWLQLWVSKGFGIHNGFECPQCTKRLQLDDDEFNNIPEKFKEFMQNHKNLDMNNANIRDVIDAVKLREGDDLQSHLTAELKGLITEPEYAINVRQLAQEAERHETRIFILILSITVALQSYAYNSISSSQSIFLVNPNPSFMALLMNEFFRDPNAPPPQDPAKAVFLILLVIACFIFEIGISRNFIAMVQTNRNRLRQHLQELVERPLREEFEEPPEGGKRKRKTKKGRKSKKNKSKKVKRNAHKKK